METKEEIGQCEKNRRPAQNRGDDVIAPQSRMRTLQSQNVWRHGLNMHGGKLGRSSGRRQDRARDRSPTIFCIAEWYSASKLAAHQRMIIRSRTKFAGIVSLSLCLGAIVSGDPLDHWTLTQPES